MRRCLFSKRRNTVTREWQQFDHGLPLGLVPGLDHCFDCALEIAIWRDYATKFPAKAFKTQNDHVAALMESASEIGGANAYGLNRPPHGKYPELSAAERREKLLFFDDFLLFG